MFFTVFFKTPLELRMRHFWGMLSLFSCTGAVLYSQNLSKMIFRMFFLETEWHKSIYTQTPVSEKPRRDLPAMAFNLGAMASNLLGVASNLEEMAFNLLAMAFNLEAMASNLLAVASNLEEMASNLEGMASNLEEMACNLLAMASNLKGMA